jgi:5-hydroxyisourate hydrolase
MGALTTHVLDTSSGNPAAGVLVDLYRLGDSAERVSSALTDHDGRCPAPLLDGDDFEAGEYELVFHAGDYFRANGVELPDPPFLDHVVIRFGMAEDRHYHVPLLISPFGYSTYRGS